MEKIKKTIVMFISLMLINGLSFALTVGELADKCKTPLGISYWLYDNVNYANDHDYYGKDYWQTPKETIELGRGDCEDFAILAQAVLKKLHIKSSLITISFKGKGKKGHMLCYWKENGKYSFMDVWCLVKTNGSFLEQTISKIYPTWNSGEIVNTNKRVLKRIRRQNED